jgi:hypothetical protein
VENIDAFMAKRDLPHSKAFSPRIAAGAFAIREPFLAGRRLYLAYPGRNMEGKVPLYVTVAVTQSATIATTLHNLYGPSIFSEEPLVRAIMAHRFYEDERGGSFFPCKKSFSRACLFLLPFFPFPLPLSSHGAGP